MGRHPSRRHTSPEEAPAGRRIRRRRRELGLTQAGLAGPEYTKSFISQLEGGYADPSLDTLRFLGRRLQLGLSTMAGDEADQRLSMLAGLLAWAESVVEKRPDAARRALDVVRDVAGDPPAQPFRGDALLLLADLEMQEGALDRARELIDDARRLSLPPGSRVVTGAELALGRLALRLGEPRGAIIAFGRALGTNRRTARHPDLAVRALIGLAAAALHQGRNRQARRRLQAAVALAERHRLEAWRGRALVRLALVEWVDGQEDRAVERLRDAHRVATAAGDARGQIDALLGQGTLLLEQGEVAGSGRALHQAEQVWQEHGGPHAGFEIAVALARLALATHDIDRADHLAADAQRRAREIGSAIARARADAVTGRVLAAHGRHGDAAATLAGALAVLGGVPDSAETAEASRALGESARAAGDLETAARHRPTPDSAAGRRRAVPWVIDLA
jgi:tetratricopeptide (TPR) repeat protein